MGKQQTHSILIRGISKRVKDNIKKAAKNNGRSANRELVATLIYNYYSIEPPKELSNISPHGMLSIETQTQNQ